MTATMAQTIGRNTPVGPEFLAAEAKNAARASARATFFRIFPTGEAHGAQALGPRKRNMLWAHPRTQHFSHFSPPGIPMDPTCEPEATYIDTH